MLATTGLPPAARAWRTSDRWPSCRLPIVGTKALRVAPASAARRSNRVCTVRIESSSVAVLRFVGEAAVAHRGDITFYRRGHGATFAREVAHEARRLACIQAKHVVQHQHLAAA